MWRLADGASLDLSAEPTERIAREAAEAARRTLWRQAAQERPRDTAGVEQGADLTVAWRLLKTAEPREAGALRCVLTGATSTPARAARQGRSDGRCDRCGTPNADEVHRFCACPARQAERAAAGLANFPELAILAHTFGLLCHGLAWPQNGKTL